MFADAFNEKNSPQLPARIKVMRIKVVKRLSVQQLADEIGVHRNTVTNWLSYEKDVSKENFVRIMEFIEHEQGRI